MTRVLITGATGFKSFERSHEPRRPAVGASPYTLEDTLKWMLLSA